MDMFVYESLDLGRPAFRLLHLLRGEGSCIECTMYQAYLGGDDTIPYDALSYTWGGTHKTFTVKVNGNNLDVTENLYLALRHLRSEDIDRVIWVDAICINQSNEQERGHQVQHMCKIYSQAEEVVVWLGQATQETDILMDALQRLDEYNSSHSKKYNHRDLEKWDTFWLFVSEASSFERRKCFNLLLSRPWFKRVWILQEIANAKKASILCGTKAVRAQTFALAPSLIGIKPARHCQAILDIMPGRLRERTWWSKSRSLYNLLLKFRESDASDPRDKVYALLGISSDAQDTDGLRPDYKKSLQEVIHDTSSFLFGPSGIPDETMSEVLKGLAPRSVTSSVELAQTSDASEVDLFPKHLFPTRRGLEVRLSEDMIKAVAGNKEDELEIMKFLHQWRTSERRITEGVLEAAASNEKNGLDIMKLLHQGREDEFTVTKAVVDAARDNTTSGMEILNFLVQEYFFQFGSIVVEELEIASTHDQEILRLLNVNIGTSVWWLHDIVWQTSPEMIRMAIKMLLLCPRVNVDVESGMHDTTPKPDPFKRHKAVLRLLLEPSTSSVAHPSSDPVTLSD